jgi:hypothetical protein
MNASGATFAGEDAGIFYEISFALHPHENVIANNGCFAAPGQAGFEWGPTWT